MDEAVENYRQTIDIDERQFQKISVDRQIYLVPVDEVNQHIFAGLQDISRHISGLPFPQVDKLLALMVTDVIFRTRKRDKYCRIISFKSFLMTGSSSHP